MNANELADWIDERNISSSSQTLGKAATMLRQQQAEIEVLKDTIAAIEKNTDYWVNKAISALVSYNIKDAAKQIGITPKTLTKRIMEGKIKSVDGRITGAEIKRYLES